MARWIALLVDMLAYLFGVYAWALIAWMPPIALCTLWYTGTLREHVWLVAIVLLLPLFGLLLLWFAKGLYDRKLGRLIFVVCFSALGVLCVIFGAVSAALSPDARYSPWQMVPGALFYVFFLVIASAGIAKRKAIMDQI
jgi:hypothetical protein